MALTSAETQTVNDIATELGRGQGHEDYDMVFGFLSRSYTDNADKPTPRLRYLYTKRDGIDLLLGGQWEDTKYTDGDVSEDLDGPTRNLIKMREFTEGEIRLLEKRKNAGRGTMVAAITRETTYGPDTGTRDPNDRAYRGDPLRRFPGSPFS